MIPLGHAVETTGHSRGVLDHRSFRLPCRADERLFSATRPEKARVERLGERQGALVKNFDGAA